MTQQYYEWLADVAQRNHDTAMLLLVCIGAALVWIVSGYMGKPIRYTVTGILSAAYLTLFIQGLMEAFK